MNAPPLRILGDDDGWQFVSFIEIYYTDARNRVKYTISEKRGGCSDVISLIAYYFVLNEERFFLTKHDY